ncbi:MAG: hypothetical protein IJB88_01455 [Clostridia bacterium]|nr:hypothetical protein [Clostridia bacterium]
MKTHDEMIRDLYARRDAYELQKQKQKKTVLRLSGVAACLIVCLTVGFGLHHQPDLPSQLPAESSVIEHSVSEGDSIETESHDTEQSRREESDVSAEISENEPDDALWYCEIIPSDVPMEEESVELDNIATVASNLGIALQAKMQLYADDAAYRYNVVVYNTGLYTNEMVEEGVLSAKEQAALLQFSTENWMRVEWMEHGDAYYCKLTADELYALDSCGITCLYVGSGKRESSQTDKKLQKLENRVELYGDHLIGVLPTDETTD